MGVLKNLVKVQKKLPQGYMTLYNRHFHSQINLDVNLFIGGTTLGLNLASVTTNFIDMENVQLELV